MCFALFIAALSFFIGQAKVIPEAIRNRGLLALPVLAVLVTMLYWMGRVRRKRALRIVAHAPEGSVQALGARS
jgi:cytochrome c-type biogenesis protein CcmH/NrfF